jgi:hypothetical protein
VVPAIEKFRVLMKDGYVPKSFHTKDRSKYKATALESKLQSLFGKDAKLYGVEIPSQSGLPSIAVTTVLEETLQGYLLTN